MGTRLGQHFLRDKTVLARIAREALANAPRVVMEVGPGHGELTEALFSAGAEKVIAIERDRALIEALNGSLVPRMKGKFELIHGDAREILPKLARTSAYPPEHCTVVGNIPYYLTGYLFRIIGEFMPQVRAVFLVQKEVAERATATAPRMNLLAAMLRGWAEPKMVVAVPRGAFVPSPKVDSALLTLEPTGKIPREELTRYFETVKKFFRHPRKTLANNLREGFSLTGARAGMLVRTLGLKETARAAELTPEHVKMLIKMVYN